LGRFDERLNSPLKLFTASGQALAFGLLDERIQVPGFERL
jgi:hypothetical protein